MSLPNVAHADNVERLAKQLSSSRDYKVRLSAALSLTKLRDARALPAFIRALNDSDKTVRGVAASSLGKLVTSSTDSVLRGRISKALAKTVARDKNSFVRSQAQKALNRLRGLGVSSVSKGGIYVNIGPMSATMSNGDTVREQMRKTVQGTFRKKAASMLLSWPGGKPPSKAQIAAESLQAFHVDGTVNALDVRTSGSQAIVSCRVSMLLATYGGRDTKDREMFGFLKGNAQVQASASKTDIRYAKADCVTAVVENLVQKKIIPTIKSKGQQ